MHYNLLDPKRCALLVIDPQDRLLKAVEKPERVIKNTILLIHTCKIMNMPIIATTQYKKGLGDITEEIKELLQGFPCLDKTEFNALSNPGIQSEMKKLPVSVDTLIITGVEAHICVYQTAIAAKLQGLNPWIVTDAISSREKRNIASTITRLNSLRINCGPAEMAVYELIKKAGTNEFKQIVRYVK